MAAPPPRPVSWREALYSALGLVVFLEIIKDLAKLGGALATALYTLAAIVQLYYPLWRLGKATDDPDAAVGLRRPGPGGLWHKYRVDVAWGVGLAALVFVPFAIGHHIFWTGCWDDVLPFKLPAHLSLCFNRSFAPALPDGALTLILTHFLGVALPEEVFYRGFVQPRLAERFKRRISILGASVGWEVPLTSFIFALGHVAGEYDPLRLAPFFPGLVFGWLRVKTGSIYGAVIFHALSNIMSAFLFANYR